MNAQQQLLIASYWDNALSEEEQAELLDLLRADPDVRAEFMNQMRLHRELEFVFSDTAEAESMALRRILLFLESSGTNDQFVADIRKKYNARPSARIVPARKSFAQQYVRESFRVNWGSRVVAALAASLLIIAGGYWLLNRSGIRYRTEYASSVSAMASVQSVEGTVEIRRAGKTVYAVAGAQIQGQDVVVASSNGKAEIKYGTEDTTIKLLSGATAKFWLQDDAKRVRLDAGTLVCKIAKQPAGKAMRFVTPNAEAMVVGTQLKLAVSNDATQLEVTEGSVKLARNDQQFVMVNAGEFAVASEGTELKAQPLKPIPAAPSPSLAMTNAPNVTSASYYAQWSNGIPADPNFFPIWVWDQDPIYAMDYKQAGINLSLNRTALPDNKLALLAAAGMKTICAQNDESLKQIGNKTIAGWLNYYQPDTTDSKWTLAGMDPATLIKRYNDYRLNDPSRPVYAAFSEGIVRDDYPLRNDRRNHPEDYREFVKGADILGLSVLPVNEPQAPVRNSLWYVARATDKLRDLSENAKPVWCAIECTRTLAESPAKPTPAQVKSEVWMALVHGANGIGYVCYSRVQGYEMAALLKDKVMLAAITGINRQITSLAPVLNSVTIPDGATVSSSNAAVPVDAMVKKHAGAIYIFAVAMREGSTTATFTVPSGSEVEVLGESRKLAITGGKFSDLFESYGVHLYKVSALSQTASK